MERDRVRERAEKRFAFITKQVDYRIAKAYVSLADDDDRSSDKKESGGGRKSNGLGLEMRAVDSYLDDLEWEEREIREGRRPKLQGFPFVIGRKGR